MATAGASIPTDLARMLPAQGRGWKAVEPDGQYDASNLFDLIDGGAEVYRALNVRAVCARRYAKEGSAEILAELFDMGSASDAFGAWHHDLRDGDSARIGQESEYAAGALAFWKGRYFVSILAMEDTPETHAAVIDLGRAIAEAIREEGEPPYLTQLLPERGLIPAQIRYFHGHESLGRYLSLGESNVLGLGPATEGIVARYREASSGDGVASRHALLVVSYPTAAEAQRAIERFSKESLVGAGGASVGRTRDGTWAGARAQERILAIVLDASAREAIDPILDDVGRRARKGRSGRKETS